MPTLNKLVESTQITYTTTTDAGDITIVLNKSDPLSYNITYSNPTGQLPLWGDFSAHIEEGFTINLL